MSKTVIVPFNGFEDEVIELLMKRFNHPKIIIYNYRGLAKKNRPTHIQKKLLTSFASLR